jgi:hypothetical protein
MGLTRSYTYSEGRSGNTFLAPPETFPFGRIVTDVKAIAPSQLEVPIGEFPGLNNRPDANSATVQEGAGPVVGHVQVYLVFWGSDWTQNSTPTSEAVTNAVVQILYGPYMSELFQYEGIGGGRLVGTKTIRSTDPNLGFFNNDVKTFVSNQLNANVLPLPTRDNEYLFFVIMPSLLVGGDTAIIGEHDWFTQFGVNIPYAWVMNDGTLEFVTTVLSHELVESCTDPNLGTITIKGGAGSPCPNTDGKNCEISDVCSSTSVVCGVQVQSYWSVKDSACVVPKNIIPGEVAANPALIQGRFLRPGNFEMICPLAAGGLSHCSRVNSIDFVPWFGPSIFGTDVGNFDALSMIQSTFTSGANIGNLEVVAIFESELLYYWREDVSPYTWHGPVPMQGFEQRQFTGNPVLIQGRFERPGNFEVVIPLVSGGIAHYSRVNELPGVPWFGPNIFGTDVGNFDAVTMIQSNYTVGPDIGLFELIARVGGELLFYFREDAPPYQWWGPLPANGFEQRLFTGSPVMIQSRFGQLGINFELVVPLVSGGLAHYWRNNDTPTRLWSGPTVFAEDVGLFDEISFIQSDFSAGAGIGNLELVARVGSSLFFYWRDDTAPFTWYGPRVVVG